MDDTQTKIELIPARLIGLRADGRIVDIEKANQLAASIRDVGLLSPIIVAAGNVICEGATVRGWQILAGQHRFHAMSRVLDWETIPCIVREGEGLRLELVIIDENLVRHELSEAERAMHLTRRKMIYELLHPQTVHGAIGNGRPQSRQGDDSAPRFTQATANLIGKSERTVQRSVARGEALGDDLAKVVGTSLDNAGELDALAKMTAEAREPVIKQAMSGKQVSARGTTKVLNEAETEEKWLERGKKWWNEGCNEWRDAFLAWISTR